MSSAVVATVAWLALALAVAALVGVALVVRELRALGRAHTDRKWEIQGLRAELVALRRHAAVDNGSSGGVVTGDDVGGQGVDDVRSPRPSPSSPTAWRRRRGRTADRSPRRRPAG